MENPVFPMGTRVADPYGLDRHDNMTVIQTVWTGFPYAQQQPATSHRLRHSENKCWMNAFITAFSAFNMQHLN